MKKLILFCSALVIAASSVKAQEVSNKLKQLEWLVGYWEGSQHNGNILSEDWKKVGDHLEGLGLVWNANDTFVMEHMRIQMIHDKLVFIAAINDAAPVLFTLSEQGANQWVFSNPEHDFPQKVVYSLTDEGTLYAWIEGKLRGEQAKDEYRLIRSKP